MPTQFFGDKVNPHVHLHALATDGAFDPDGNFHRLSFDMQNVEANAHVYGFDDGHAEHDADATWSQGDWDNA